MPGTGGRPAADVWQYFEKVYVEDKLFSARCKHCEGIVSPRVRGLQNHVAKCSVLNLKVPLVPGKDVTGTSGDEEKVLCNLIVVSNQPPSLQETMEVRNATDRFVFPQPINMIAIICRFSILSFCSLLGSLGQAVH